MFRATLILLGLTAGVVVSGSAATTYYLDSESGSDFHSGTTITSAWKTLRYASSKVYHPGDQILLKAGSVWSGETFNLATSGESGDAITISSYGTGNQPVIDGANGRDTLVTLRNAQNVAINGLAIQDSGSSLIAVYGGSNNSVTNCALLNSGVFPVQVRGSAGFTFANNTYASTGSYKTIASVFMGFGSPSTGLTVTGNTITLNSASNGARGIYILDTNNAVVSGNRIVGGSQAIGIKAYHASVTGAQLHDNSIYYTDRTAGDGESIEFTGKDGTSNRVSGSIYHNFIQGGPDTTNAISGFQATDTAIYNNIIIGPLLNAAIHWSSSSTDAVLYGNTIHDVRVAFAIFSGSSAAIFNNIVSKAEVGISTNAKVVEDYNDFFESGGRDVSKGAHSTTLDPMFVSTNPASPLDVKLRSGSPAVHSGRSLDEPFKEALSPKSTAFPCAILDQARYGWNRGAFGSE